MITQREPEDWHGLQEDVAQILRECGFAVEVEKPIATSRGEVAADVYAEEIVQARKYRILCECKYWKTRVPQTVIHAFRTIVSDSGVNLGYIVSRAGFQSGALSAVELTSVYLHGKRFNRSSSRLGPSISCFPLSLIDSSRC